MSQSANRTPSSDMPSLTIDGKRKIIQLALAAVGEKKLTSFLKTHQIDSIRVLNEQVRKHKASFFRQLFLLSQPTSTPSD